MSDSSKSKKDNDNRCTSSSSRSGSSGGKMQPQQHRADTRRSRVARGVEPSTEQATAASALEEDEEETLLQVVSGTTTDDEEGEATDCEDGDAEFWPATATTTTALLRSMPECRLNGVGPAPSPASLSRKKGRRGEKEEEEVEKKPGAQHNSEAEEPDEETYSPSDDTAAKGTSSSIVGAHLLQQLDSDGTGKQRYHSNGSAGGGASESPDAVAKKLQQHPQLPDTPGAKRFKDEATGEWTCPVCNTSLDSQHAFTVHIRQHNPTDHSHTCSICGKTLSSASSLDRHMLIHSGERPFKCRICNMAFTTNGNMHRHMRTHGMELHETVAAAAAAVVVATGVGVGESDPNSLVNRFTKSGVSGSTKKRKAVVAAATEAAAATPALLRQHRHYHQVSSSELRSPTRPPSPKMRRGEQGGSSSYGGDEDADDDEDDDDDSNSSCASAGDYSTNRPGAVADVGSTTCRDCGARAMRGEQHHCQSRQLYSKGTDGTKPGDLSTPNVGFYDLTFTDFSSNKFSLIAKSICESNIRKSSSPYHDFECGQCKRAFPCSSALAIHLSNGGCSASSSTYCTVCRCDLGSQALAMSHRMKHQLEGTLPYGANSSTFSQQQQQSLLADLKSGKFSDKQGFMAMLKLHNRDDVAAALLPSSAASKFAKDELFENPAYYVHAKPPPSPAKAASSSFASSRQVNGSSSSDGGDLGGKIADLADIQSIISVTSAGNHLQRNIRSSPPAASPASPQEDGNGANKPTSSALTGLSKKDTRPSDKEAMNGASDSAAGGCGSDSGIHDSSKDGHDLGSEESISVAAATEPIFKCTVCPLTFKSLNALKRHNRGHTQGGHSYQCQLCPYTSLDKSTLVRHLRTHNGERPFQCTICKYAFTTKANCERHVRKRHKKSSKGEITVAMQYNSEMNYGALTVQNINGHNSSANGDNSMDGSLNMEAFPNSTETVCKYCNVDFKFNRVLRHHLRSLHNSCNRKPYCCIICKLGFSTKNNCIRHVIKQHPTIEDKLGSILVNGVSLALQSGSDFSETDSTAQDYPASYGDSYSGLMVKSAGSSASSRNDSDRPSPPPLQDMASVSRNLSLAALCQVAGKSNSSQPLNLAKNSTSTMNGVPEELIDLSNMKTNTVRAHQSSNSEQPLNLVVHALDLSVKSKGAASSGSVKEMDVKPFDLRKSDNATQSAANTLLALQTVASRFPAFPTAMPSMHSSLFSAAKFPFGDIGQLAAVAVAAAASSPRQGGAQFVGTAQSPSSLVASVMADSFLKIVNAADSSGGGKSSSIISNSNGQQQHISPKHDRNFTCRYCTAGFTLKSNMERHIKRKHPQFAKPPRSSRGSSSAGATPAKGSKETTVAGTEGGDGTHSILSKPSNNVSNGGSNSISTTLSNTTRAALRDVLNSKALASGYNSNIGNNFNVNSNNQEHSRASSPSGSLTSSVDHQNHRSDGGTESQDEDYEEDGIGDLASVSSLIETTAHSSNTLKKYFERGEDKEMDTESCEAPRSDDQNDSQEDERDQNSMSGSDDSTLHSGKQGERDVTKKRSAYTDSPNSVSCPYCLRRFPWSSSLRRHLLTHTGLKPYKCPRCPILFTTKSNCERHLIRKHKRSEQKAKALIPSESAVVAVVDDNSPDDEN